MRLRAIGGMAVRRDGGWHPVGALKQRVLLAILLADLGSPVPMDLLVDELWRDRPPDRPQRQVHMLVWRLRRLFGDRDVVQTVRPGYRLALNADECDVGRFEDLRARGQTLLRDGDPATAVELLTEAVALWRGPAYADARTTPTVAAEVVRLEESNLTAWESLLEAELRLGHHDRVVARLQALVAEHPFRERLRALQMSALYVSGRQAEALDAYHTVYRLLAEELGIQPGRELRQLQQRILTAGPEPEAPGMPMPEVPGMPDAPDTTPDVSQSTGHHGPSGPPPAVARAAVELPAVARPSDPAGAPAELPPDVLSLAGRDAEVQRLLSLATPASRPCPDVPAIAVIDGMPGVGKTALAVHAAHRLADRFPDGQVFVNLHGFTGGAGPMSVQQALERLLRSVGVAGTRIPTDQQERAALWRTCTANRRYLVVLDNAASGGQLEPLLPASADCAVIVTSRRRLADVDDATALSLGTLPVAAAVALLRSLLGSERLDQTPSELVEQAAELCGLPLALRLLASRLRSRPAWAIEEVVERLRDDRHELVELDVGGRSIAAAFRISYEQLDPTDQRLFRLIGLHPGADLDRYAATALAELDPLDVERRLERLVDTHLLEARAYGRYVLHDLVRTYAAGVAEREESEVERIAAIERLLDYYLSAAGAAMDAYAPAEKHRRPEAALSPTVLPSFMPPVSAAGAGAASATGAGAAGAGAAGAGATGHGQDRADDSAAKDVALRWLDTERANMITLAGYAAQNGWPEHAWRFSGCLHRYLQNASYLSAASELYDHHLRAARAAGNSVEEGRALLSLGVTHYRDRDHATALRLQRRALDCLPDEPRQDRAQVFYNLGLVLQASSDLTAARDRFEQAAGAFRTLGDTVGEARTASALARVSRLLGRYDEAEAYARRALATTRESDRQGVSLALFSLGMAHRATGRYEQALEDLTGALRLRREIENRLAEGAALAAIGGALRGLARHEEALRHGRTALDIALELGDAGGRVDALQEIGETLLAYGRASDARDELVRALDLVEALGQPPDLARVLHVLGDACRELGEHDRAREHWRAALGWYERLGMPEASTVRRRLGAA